MATKKPFFKSVTPAGTAAFAWIARPDEGHQYSDGKYKITLVLDGDADLDAIRKIAMDAAKAEFPNVSPSEFQLVFLQNGDDKNKEEFAGKTLLIAKTKNQPQCVDAKRKPLPEGVEVRSGDIVKLALVFYPFSKTEKVKVNGKMVNETTYSVAARLNAVQLLEKRNNGGNAASDFDEEDGYEAPNGGSQTSAGNGDDDAEDF